MGQTCNGVCCEARQGRNMGAASTEYVAATKQQLALRNHEKKERSNGRCSLAETLFFFCCFFFFCRVPMCWAGCRVGGCCNCQAVAVGCVVARTGKARDSVGSAPGIGGLAGVHEFLDSPSYGTRGQFLPSRAWPVSCCLFFFFLFSLCGIACWVCRCPSSGLEEGGSTDVAGGGNTITKSKLRERDPCVSVRRGEGGKEGRWGGKEQRQERQERQERQAGRRERKERLNWVGKRARIENSRPRCSGLFIWRNDAEI